MKLNVNIRQINDKHYEADILKFTEETVANSFAEKLVDLIKHDSSCLTIEKIDQLAVTRHYELFVFTPDELRKMMNDIQIRMERGMPVVF